MNEIITTDVMKTAIKLFENGHKIKNITQAISKLYPEFKVELTAISAIEMYKSLVLAIDKAGGSGWAADELFKMTVMDLICHLATNKIRFTFEKEKKK